MRPIHLGCEYPYPQGEEIYIVKHYGVHGDGHGVNGAYFPNGGQLAGLFWESTVKIGASRGHQVLAGLGVSMDGKNPFTYIITALHQINERLIPTKEKYREIWPVGKHYDLPKSSYIHVVAHGYPVPRFDEPIPPGDNIEFQITLWVETDRYEVG